MKINTFFNILNNQTHLNKNSSMLNIPSTVNDPNYRYVMPKMQLKIQSKGNGIKTNIVNLSDVAKHLRTQPDYILKFFGFERASQTTQKSSQSNSKKQQKSNTSYIIQGSFSEQQLLKTLDKFIDKYILCPKCKLPEMHLYVINGDKIQGKCDSCPFNGDVDNKHRLASYIIKKPPSFKPQAPKNPQQKIQKIKQIEKHQKIGVMTKKEEKKQQEKQQKASEIFSSDNMEFGSQELQNLVQYTREFIQSRKKQDFDIASAEIVAELKPLNLKKPLYAYVLFNSFFTINLSKQVVENSKLYLQLMKKLVIINVETETMLNLQYLFLQINKDKDFSKFMSTILLKAYQNQLFSEEFIIEWSKGKIKDLEKMFLYNQTRNQKCLEISDDFISYVIGDESDQQKSEKADSQTKKQQKSANQPKQTSENNEKTVSND